MPWIARNTSILDEHYYFRVSPPDTTPRDIPVFAKEDPVFMPYPRLSKGVHCRFGYAGIIAEAHFDGSRNIVVELGGPPSSTGHANSGRSRSPWPSHRNAPILVAEGPSFGPAFGHRLVETR